jgi:hypothetical protein
MMAATISVNDFRKFLRTHTDLACQFAFEEITHKAVITNLSLEGACLSSNFLPPIGSTVTVSLQSPHSEIALSLQARVIHDGGSKSSQAKPHRFGVRFRGIHPEIARLNNKSRT